MYKLTVFCLLAAITNTQSARILGVFPTASISHQVVFRALYTELVKRGHELVVLTTDPLYRNKTSPDNLKEIDLGALYAMTKETLSDPRMTLRRGVIIEADDWYRADFDPFFTQSSAIFQFKEVKDLIQDKNQKFDLILVESLSHNSLMFCEVFKAPAILFSSFYGVPHNFETVGAVARHPILYPHFVRNKFKNLNIFEKVFEVYREWKYYNFEKYGHEKNVNEYLHSNFGPFPPVSELKKYVSMLFINVHPIFDGNRPTPPGVVYLNSLHLLPVKELPQDLKAYLDNSKRGVVYVSLGTNVDPSLMAPELINTFLDAFEALPFDILWKFNGAKLEKLPKNVKIQKWFPQRDLLGHPNIKLFISQGGLQSLDEAIDSVVPLVGIPFLGDQYYNVNKYEELGIGVALDTFTFNADDLVKAVNDVVNDKRYKENVLKLKNILHDQPEKPLDRAVWWTEYVLRHNGSRHLLPKAADVSWSEYLMVDVLVALAVILVLGVSLFVLLINFIISNLRIVAKIRKE